MQDVSGSERFVLAVGVHRVPLAGQTGLFPLPELQKRDAPERGEQREEHGSGVIEQGVHFGVVARTSRQLLP